MKVTFIATVYNEESTVGDLLQSLSIQSKVPDEVIIVDGGSTDNTLLAISNFLASIRRSGQFPRLDSAKRAISKNKVKVISKKGNRAVGRNQAIKNASNEIITCSDSGCILDKDWIDNIAKPFEDEEVDVVAGYYKGDAKDIFQKCLVPYVLVMPDKIAKEKFLPASRSMAFRKSAWKRAGGFPEEFSNNEDYVFSKKLKKINAKIVFEKKAIVYWKPRNNIKEAFIMFYRFAKGDSESHIFRPKVIIIFLRYIILLSVLFSFFILKSNSALNTFILMLLLYVLWSIIKNYKYVKDARAILLLPLIQIISDKAVILGTINGLLTQRLKILIEGFFYILVIYLIILLNFRQLRSLFSPPRITENGIVGYAHYFGYPLYFETIIFFVFILSPVVVFFILSLIRRYRD